jgi:Spirocyclase AveC-like
MVVVAAAAELIFLRTNAIANIRTADMLTVRFGGYDEWPLYNPILFGLVWTAMAWLRWSRDDDGLSAVERGANQLGTGSRRQSAARFLAIFAFVQVTYIVLYFVPWNLFALMSASPAPLPSYFPTP